MNASPNFDPFAVLEKATQGRPHPETRHTPEPKVGPAKVANPAKVCPSPPKSLATLAGGTGENPLPACDTVRKSPSTDDPVTWRHSIAERAAILEYDASKPRAEVERLAYEAALARWQNENPPTNADQDHCAACGDWLLDDLLPLAERNSCDQTVWVHASGDCWRKYVRKRRAEAEAAMRQ